MSHLWTILGFLALLPYLIIPLFFWRRQRIGLSLQVRQQVTEFLPQATRKIFDAVNQTLSTKGFHVLVDAVCHDLALGVKRYFRFYQHPTLGVNAIAESIVLDDEREAVYKSYLGFVTHFKNGTELYTHNADFIGLPIEKPNRKVSVFGFVQDLSKLLAIHVERMRQVSQMGNLFITDANTDPLAFLQASQQSELDYQVESGGLWVDKEQQCLRPTFAGALVMTWTMLWPFAWLRKTGTELRSRLWLRINRGRVDGHMHAHGCSN